MQGALLIDLITHALISYALMSLQPGRKGHIMNLCYQLLLLLIGGRIYAENEKNLHTAPETP